MSFGAGCAAGDKQAARQAGATETFEQPRVGREGRPLQHFGDAVLAPRRGHLSAAYPGLPGPFTADSISMSDFLLDWQAQLSDTFILQIAGFSLGGSTVPVLGLGTTFGLYIEGTTKVVGTPSVYGPGTISLVLDPTNNDGTPSATVNLAASTGAVGFSHPLNTGDDITLATGSLTYGQFPLPNGQPGVYFIETFRVCPGSFRCPA